MRQGAPAGAWRGAGGGSGSGGSCARVLQRTALSGVCELCAQLRWARSLASLFLTLSLSLWELKKLKFAKRNVTKQYSWGPSYNPSTRWQSTRRARGRWSAPRTLVAALAICWLSRSAWRRAEDALFKTRSRERSGLPQKSYPHSRRIAKPNSWPILPHAPMLPCSHAPMLPTGVPAW